MNSGMSLDQRKELTEKMSSEVSSYQQGQLIEKEDKKSILMIGGIEVFLPHRLAKVKNCVADVATTEGQRVVTVREKEEPEQTLKYTPAEEEHSAEMLKIFSQEVEQGITTALEAVAEEENADKMLTPWEMELEMMEDWLNHPDPVDDCHEKTVMQMLAEKHSEESLRNFIQEAEQLMMIAMPRHAAEGESKF
jgi:hypothetical protein